MKYQVNAYTTKFFKKDLNEDSILVNDCVILQLCQSCVRGTVSSIPTNTIKKHFNFCQFVATIVSLL